MKFRLFKFILVTSTMLVGSVENTLAATSLDCFSGACDNNTLSYNNEYYSMTVSGTGTADNTIVDYSANLYVKTGGSVTNTTVNSNGEIHVNGGTATTTTINSNGKLSTSSGTVDGLTVNSDGKLDITTDANITNATYNGTAFSVTGGTATDVTLSRNSELDVNNGHNATGTTVLSGATLNVSGTATNSTVNGTINVSGTANNTTVDDGHINSTSGTVDTITLTNNGTFHFSTDATVTTVTQDNAIGTFDISSGHAQDVLVNGGSQLDVNSGDTSNNTVVNSNGKLYAEGTSTDVVVDSGGYIQSLEGTVTNLDLAQYGEFYFTTDATVTEVEQGGNAGSSTDKIKNNHALDLHVNQNSRLDVGRSGTSTAGTSENIVVNNDGKMYVFRGGNVHNTDVNNGGYIESLDGTVDRFDLQEFGEFYFTTDATVTDVVQETNDGTFQIKDNAAQDIIINQNSRLDVGRKGTTTAGTSTNVVVNNDGVMYVYEGGAAQDTTVNDGGHVYVGESSVNGGKATNNTINTGGIMDVYNKGLTENTAVSGGTLNIYSGSTGNNNTVTNAGIINVSSGGVASETTATNGTVNVSGEANVNTITESGVLNINTGGSANMTTVGSRDADASVTNGIVNVAGGGEAIGNNIYAGGLINVEAGAKTDITLVENGGLIDIKANGTATNMTVNNGGGFISNTDTFMSGRIELEDGSFREFNVDSQTANNLAINGKSQFTANMGGKLINTLISNGGQVSINEGAEANNTEVGKDGKFNVFEGGSVKNTTVNEGGLFTVEANSIAFDTIVNTGGTVITDANSILENLYADSNATLTFDANTILRGDISLRDDTIMNGGITYDDIFGNYTYDSLTITGGMNENVKDALANTATDKDRSLILRDGTFVFNGVDDEYQISGWNKLNLVSTATDKPNLAKLNGNLTLAGTDKILYISENSTLDVSGNSPLNITIDGNMVNEGLLDFTLFDKNGEADDSTRLTGNYFATGSNGPDGSVVGGDSILHVNVDAKNGVADKLIVDGDVAGKTKVVLDITNGKRSKNEILFVESPNDDPLTEASFDIWRINGSSSTWESYQKDDLNWYLKASGIAPEIIAYAGLPSAGMEQTRSLTRNIKSAINSGMNYNMNCCRTADCNCNCWDDHMINLWVKPVYESTTVDKLYEFEASISGLEAGVDLFTTNHHKLGVFASWRKGSYDFSGKGDTVSANMTSSIDINSYLGGLYYRYDRSGFWALATAFGGIQQYDIATEDDFTADSDATEYGGSLELGLILPMTDTFNIEPGIGVTYTSLSIDDIHDDFERDVVYDDARQLEAEAGIKFEKSWLFDISTLKTYVRPSIVKSFVSGNSVAITDYNELQTLDDQLLGRVEIGFNFDLLDSVDTYGSLSQTMGSDYESTSASLGLSYRF